MAVVNPRGEAAFYEWWGRVSADPGVVTRAIVADGVLAGSISCFRVEGLDWVGYWIGREFWGRGIASRALALFVEDGAVVAALAGRPLNARAARTNVGSLKVLERCGFVVTEYRWEPASERFPACEEAVLVRPGRAVGPPG